MKANRLIADCILFIAVFWLPWWLLALLCLIALFLFDSFYEILFFAIIFDSFYSLPLSRFYHFQFVATMSALVLFTLIEALKKRLRFYS